MNVSSQAQNQNQNPARIDWTKPPATFLDLGHSELAYRRVGHGPDLLFVHGWPVSGATFRGVVAELADRFTCHVVDLPGAGFSRCREPERISLTAHVDTVAEVVDRLGLERYGLVAHDSGGLVARHLAARDGRVAALVLGNTEIPGHHPPLLAFFILTARLPGGSALFGKLLGSPRFRRSTLGFGTCFHDPAVIEGEFYELCARPIIEDARRRDEAMRLLTSLDPAIVADLEAIHGRIEVPVKLVWGAEDPFFPLAKAEAMLPQFPDADLTVLRPGKLFVHEERPADFARAALPVLEAQLRAEAAA
ncbi:MAG: alpha/beta hydrolase [Myxococcales bacterium]|nr:alpha/beta hydrolase [Myxococcales bacterium]